MGHDEPMIPWGVRAHGYPIIVWAADERTAVSLAFEWLDYVEKIGQAEVEVQRTRAERLGEARPWSEVEPHWHSHASTAWDAAKERGRRMRELLGVKRWWLAISDTED